MPFVSAVIVAGGSSSRMRGTDKLSFVSDGVPVLRRTVSAFQDNAFVDEIAVVCREDKTDETRRMLEGLSKVSAIVPGGRDRTESVKNGVAAVSSRAEYVAVHDGARPFVSDGLITRTIQGAIAYGACAPALAVSDTLKRTDRDGFIVETVPRDGLSAVQTPQVFEKGLFLKALGSGVSATDDCALVELSGDRVKLVEGERGNIKLTYPADLELRGGRTGAVRVGSGYDVHRLVGGRRLVLGGVEIPFEKGLLGHSDADVLTHAVCDALLGAAAAGDIGVLFPDDDPRYEGADSIELLRAVTRRLCELGFKPFNIDATAVCQRPKLRPYIDSMREKIAEAAGLGMSFVSVKATTEEGLGFTGSGEGIAALASATVVPRGGR